MGILTVYLSIHQYQQNHGDLFDYLLCVELTADLIFLRLPAWSKETSRAAFDVVRDVTGDALL